MKLVFSFFIFCVLSFYNLPTAVAGETLPPLYIQADFNQNGSIEHEEVLTCIEEFFFGHNRYSEEEIYLLIEFYLDHAIKPYSQKRV